MSSDPPFTCVACEAPVTGAPVFHVGLPFCCAGCVANGPCVCSYDEEEATPHDRPAALTFSVPAGVADDLRSLAGTRG